MIAASTRLSVISLFTGSGRKTLIGFLAASTSFKDDGINKIKMVIVINKNVTIHRIEDVVLIIGIVSAIILCMKSESWCEVVIRISEIIQLYDFSTISR